MPSNIYSPEYRRLVRLLRELRTDAGLTQTDLARSIREPQSFVSKYENGQIRLDLVQVRLIAKALGTTATKIVQQWERSR